MRYLAEPAWAPHNPKLSWREIDAATAEVSAVSPAGKAQVRLIFENGDITRVEADDRPRIVGRCTVPTRWEGTLLRLPRAGSLPYSDPRGSELVTGGRSV